MSKQNDFFGASPNTVLNKPFMHVQEQRPQGSNSLQTSIVGTQTRLLNTVLTNGIPGASLGGSSISLPAGTYYFDCRCTIGGNTSQSKARLYSITDSAYILEGTCDGSFIPSVVIGQLTFSTAKVLELRNYTAASAVTMGTAQSQGTEVYADLKIWQLDAVVTTPVIGNTNIYPIPGNAIVEGNMFGLEYARTGNNQVTIQPGICMDSRNTTICSLASQQNLTLPTVINGIYNLFICNDGVVRYDTDVNGSSLSAYKIRWIGFVRNNASGVLCGFTFNSGVFAFTKPSEAVFVSSFSSTSYVNIDLSPLVPVSRLAEVYIGIVSSSIADAYMHISGDGVNALTYTVGYSNQSDIQQPWGNSAYSVTLRSVPYSSGLMMKMDAGSVSVGLAQAKLRR